MSTHRNSNNQVVATLMVVTGLVILLVLVSSAVRRSSGLRLPSPSRSVQTVTPRPSPSPMAWMVASRPGQARQPGTAVAVVVDVSGSMREPVSSGVGQTQPKIEIARAGVLRLLRQVDRFVQEHPDKPVLVGVYEFSARARVAPCRRVVPLGPPDMARMESAVSQMRAEGDTPIGDALIFAKQELNATGRSHQHILVVTDGENNRGYSPEDVVSAISRLPEEDRASVYCIAFDIAADRFRSMRDAGGLVLGAVNEGELQQTMDYVLTGRILAEQPEWPKVDTAR